MTEYDYDLFVIGVGSGGMRATRHARKTFGVEKVGCCDMPFSQLSVEGRSICDANTVGGVGGTCVLRGCVPKKYFWYASHFKHVFEDAKGYGWDVDVKEHKWEVLMNKKRERMIASNKRLVEKAFPKDGVDVLTGRGKLIDAHTIEVGAPANKTVTAKTILIATGTTPSIIDLPGKEHCISSDHILNLDTRPKKLAVLGAGYIACEFACMFALWGTETHVIYRKDLPLRGFDDDCREFLARQMERSDGVKLHKETNPVKVEKQEDGKYTVYTKKLDGTEDKLTDCDEVLMATGRHANVWNLGLEAAGVQMENKRIKVDEYSRTSVENIFAIGDVTDRMQLTPVAIQEAMAFLYYNYGDKKYSLDYKKIASAVFTQPPMGTVGLTEEEAVKKYPNVDIIMDGDGGGWQAEYFDMTDSNEEMLLKIIINADDDKVLGIHIVSKDAGEIMQGFGAAMLLGVTKQNLFDTVAIHPTIAEEIVCCGGIDMMKPCRKYRDHKKLE